MMKSRWINRVTILGVVLITLIGGFWLWDAKDYPIPWTDKFPLDPFADPLDGLSWNTNRSFLDNIQLKQSWLRYKKADRLRKKWIRNLDFQDSYWAIYYHGENSDPTVFFDRNGSIEVRLQPQQSSFYTGFTNYQYPGNGLLNIEREKYGESITYKIYASSKASLHLYNSTHGSFNLERLPNSNSFDSLPKAE